MSSQRYQKYFRILSRISSTCYFYNQFKGFENKKKKLNHPLYHLYLPIGLDVGFLLGEYFYAKPNKLFLGEVLFSDFLIKNNTFFKIKKLVDQPKLVQAEEHANEFADGLMDSLVSLGCSINQYCEPDTFFNDGDSANIKLFNLSEKLQNENYIVLMKMNKTNFQFKFYLFDQAHRFVSYFFINDQYEDQEKGYIAQFENFFKAKSAKKGIGKIFFNWGIDFFLLNKDNLFKSKKIRLSTNKFLNKTALAIYKEKQFKIIKEHDNKSGDITLEFDSVNRIKNEKFELNELDQSDFNVQKCLEKIDISEYKLSFTKEKMIKSFLAQFNNYFSRFKKEKSIDEINSNKAFLAYFREHCIDAVESYVKFPGDHEATMRFLKRPRPFFKKKEIEDDSIEKIEEDFKEMVIKYE